MLTVIFLVLEEPKHERKRKGATVGERKIDTSCHLVLAKEKFVFLSIVSLSGNNLLCDSEICVYWDFGSVRFSFHYICLLHLS